MGVMIGEEEKRGRDGRREGRGQLLVTLPLPFPSHYPSRKLILMTVLFPLIINLLREPINDEEEEKKHSL